MPQIKPEVEAFIEKVRTTDRSKRSAEDFEKEGVFTGSFCINPLTGTRMPIYLANFVLMDYGTGAVMAVPTHDQRDFEFARKYSLPLQIVIQPAGETLDAAMMTEALPSPASSATLAVLTVSRVRRPRRSSPTICREKESAQRRLTFVCVIGAFPGNAIGATPFRLFTVMCAVWCRSRWISCRRQRRR